MFPGEYSKDYGHECLDILMQVMENDRDKIVVILAGYKDRMDRFFRSNPGMGSRIAHHLDFADYTVEELLAISGLMLDRSSYYLSPQAEADFRDDLPLQMKQPGFANARSVRNALEGARPREARNPHKPPAPATERQQRLPTADPHRPGIFTPSRRPEGRW